MKTLLKFLKYRVHFLLTIYKLPIFAYTVNTVWQADVKYTIKRGMYERYIGKNGCHNRSL